MLTDHVPKPTWIQDLDACDGGDIQQVSIASNQQLRATPDRGREHPSVIGITFWDRGRRRRFGSNVVPAQETLDLRHSSLR